MTHIGSRLLAGASWPLAVHVNELELLAVGGVA